MNDDQAMEKLISESKPTEPRVTIGDVLEKVKSKTFTILPSGKVMICEITLENGFTVRGEASVVNKKNFREEIGKEISFKKAFDKIWELEGYLLQERLYRESLT